MRLAQMLMVTTSALMLSGCMQQRQTTKVSSLEEGSIEINLNQVVPQESKGKTESQIRVKRKARRDVGEMK